VAFCGDDGVAQKVSALKAIPSTVDAWVGTVIGAKIYFEYLLWKLAVADMDLRGRMDAKATGWKPFGNDAPPPTPDFRDQEALFNRTEAATRIIGHLTDAVGGPLRLCFALFVVAKFVYLSSRRCGAGGRGTAHERI
jgi:hypothetical protein